MLKRSAIFIAFTIMSVGFSLSASAKDSLSQNNKTQVINDLSFEKMLQTGRPNESHLLLGRLVGVWNYSAKIWMGPNTEPEESSGTSENVTILDGRFVSMKSAGILLVGGHYLPFEANGLMGYDSIQKNFTSVWMDNFDSGMMKGEGKLDTKNNVVSESGTFTSVLNASAQTYRSELDFIDVRTYKRSIFLKDKSGKEYKSAEFLYTQKR